MTTITIEIGKNNDLSALKAYLSKSGFKFEVDEQDDFSYSKELKQIIDQRYAEYENGAKMISAEESKRQIDQLLSHKNK